MNHPRHVSVFAALDQLEAGGADVLMAPGLPDLAAVRTVCTALSRPFNFMAGIKGKSFSVAELAETGVKRISLATSLYRAAMTGLLNAAREVKEKGTLGYIDTGMPTPELNAFSTSTAGAALVGVNVKVSSSHCARSSLYSVLPIAPVFDPRSTVWVHAWLYPRSIRS